MEVRIQRVKDVELPTYSREGDVAFDLRSAEELVIKPGEKKVVDTGLKIAVPDGHAGLIWDRSGMAGKHGIHVMAGVLDPNFRGELVVVLKHLGTEDFKVEKNMRIAQMLIQPVLNAKITEVDKMEETERGEGKFSSSGYH